MLRLLRAVVLAAACAPAPAAVGQPVPPARLSVATDGTQGNGFSNLVEISRDGRQVLFIFAGPATSSQATRTAPPTSSCATATRTATASSTSQARYGRSASVKASAASNSSGQPRCPALSGRPLRAVRDRRPLVATDTNGVGDAYLRDRDADADGVFDEPGAVTLERVSTGTGGVQGDQLSAPARMTDSGRFVLFSTASTTLQPRPVHGVTQFYRKDRQTGVTTLVSANCPTAPPGDLSTF